MTNAKTTHAQDQYKFPFYIFRFFESLLSQRKLIFDSAQAARAHPFSAARERVERDRKGGVVCEVHPKS